MASAASQKMSREDFRKQKELEEARKAGTAPAEVDEEGRDINPHIPQYISKAPWYLGMDKPTLKHQRPQAEKQQDSARIDEWFKRGAEAKEQVAATRYRKGACSNCGAMTHKRKDCLERPRRVGAKFTNKDIAPDEAAQPALQLDFDGKRDRWNGYDPREHQKVIDEYEKMEQIKRKIKEEQLAKEGENSQDKGLSSDDSSSDDDGERDEEKGYTETTAQPGTKVDTKRRITVRNLRIREDTAKYLRNLDLNSAYYDPKTRSMRSNPYAGTGKAPEDVNFVGDNFLRASGEVKEVAQQQLFAWDAADRGADIHLQADPTKAALMHKQHEAKRKEMKDKQKTSILEMYGGEKHLDAPPKELLLAQTEGYVEYSKFGNVIKGQEKAAVRSKYEEDVFPGNHTSVWGSHWRNGRWGYACCYSLERASYCTGEKGRDAVLAEGDKIAMLEKGGFAPSGHSDAAAATKKTLVELHREKQEADTKSKSGKAKKEKKKKKKKKRKHDSSSDDDDDEHETVIQKKMQEQKQAEAEAERLLQMDERDRPYNSSKRDFQDVTDDDMEAFRRKRQRADDPMANFM